MQPRARIGAVTLIQRFGSALNPNIHFHLLVLDGVYEVTAAGPRFRRGLLVRDAENAYLGTGPGEDSALASAGHSGGVPCRRTVADSVTGARSFSW